MTSSDGAESGISHLDVEELISSNEQSNRTMLSLIESVHKETEARDRKIAAIDRQQKSMRWAIGLVCVGITILIAVGVINATNIANTRKQTDALAHVADEVDATNKTLLDCITAQGQCGQANANVQMKLLEEVKKYELTGFYCIRNNPAPADPDAEDFLKCMKRLYPGGPTLEKR